MKSLIFVFVLFLICAQFSIGNGKLNPKKKNVCQKKSLAIVDKEYKEKRDMCVYKYNTDGDTIKCFKKLDDERENNITYVCCDGYKEDDHHSCQPVCENGCPHGNCIMPNLCVDCALNYGGSNCDEPCPYNTWGLECENNCTTILDPKLNKNYKLCKCDNEISDDCEDICKCRSHSCKPGYKGKNCDESCDPFTYGYLCKDCQCVKNNTIECIKESGECECKDHSPNGTYYGERCENFCSGTIACDLGTCTCTPSEKEQIDGLTTKSFALNQKNLDLEKSNKYSLAFIVIFAAMFLAFLGLVFYYKFSKIRPVESSTVSYLNHENIGSILNINACEL